MKKEVTMDMLLERAGIATIKQENVFYLEYNGKVIKRPWVQKCIKVCKKEFKINLNKFI